MAHLFHIDPVVVLLERNVWRRAARIAAAQHIIDKQAEANEKAKARGRR